jgi:hypothetical protein
MSGRRLPKGAVIDPMPGRTGVARLDIANTAPSMPIRAARASSPTTSDAANPATVISATCAVRISWTFRRRRLR